MISSASGKQVKRIIQLNKKAKFRRSEGVFVVEGPKMYEEVPKDWVEKVYVSEQFAAQSGISMQQYCSGCEWELVSDSVFRAMSDTMTPQGILLTVKIPAYSLEQLLRTQSPKLLLLENIQDTGNLGTMFRTAEGAGFDGIIMTTDTVDVFHPKTIRSTMGSIYRMPFLVTDDLCRVMTQLQARQITVYAAYLDGSVCYEEADYTKGCAVLIGNEGNGLKYETAKCSDVCVRIPMEGKLESLNAAMAAGVLMYEANRQCRTLEKR
jgi:TrmH family RNA methyltransferase